MPPLRTARKVGLEERLHVSTALQGMKGTPLGLDVRAAVLALAVQGGETAEYEAVQAVYRNVNSPRLFSHFHFSPASQPLGSKSKL